MGEGIVNSSHTQISASRNLCSGANYGETFFFLLRPTSLIFSHAFDVWSVVHDMWSVVHSTNDVCHTMLYSQMKHQQS